MINNKTMWALGTVLLLVLTVLPLPAYTEPVGEYWRGEYELRLAYELEGLAIVWEGKEDFDFVPNYKTGMTITGQISVTSRYLYCTGGSYPDRTYFDIDVRYNQGSEKIKFSFENPVSDAYVYRCGVQEGGEVRLIEIAVRSVPLLLPPIVEELKLADGASSESSRVVDGVTVQSRLTIHGPPDCKLTWISLPKAGIDFEWRPHSLLTFEELEAKFGPDSEPGLSKMIDDYKHGRPGAQEVPNEIWREEQKVPGGLFPRVTAFKQLVVGKGGTFHVNSAFRPLLYQAHFWDIRRQAVELEGLLDVANLFDKEPENMEACLELVEIINDEVKKHGPLVHTKREFNILVGGESKKIELLVPNLVAYPPNGPHVRGIGADITITVPDGVDIDELAHQVGLWRPAPVKDPVHFDIPSVTLVFGPITITGESPINILVKDPSGRKIGFDPASNRTINELGKDIALYSGPFTKPQRIDIYSTITGSYVVTAVGTGAGPYAITYGIGNGDGIIIESGVTKGIALLGKPIDPVVVRIMNLSTQASLPPVGEQVARAPIPAPAAQQPLQPVQQPPPPSAKPESLKPPLVMPAQPEEDLMTDYIAYLVPVLFLVAIVMTLVLRKRGRSPKRPV